MEPTNPNTPINPISPQPLSTDAAKPTDMPMGVPMQPAGGTPPGLPAELPPTGPVKSTGGSKKMIMIVLIIVVVIALLGAGGYYFWSMQNQESVPEEEAVTVEDDPELEQLRTETQEIDIQDPQAEITQVTSEISLLEATPSASASSSAKPKASP